MSSSRTVPRVEIYDHHAGGVIDLDWLQEKAQRAVPICLRHGGTETPVLPDLEVIEVSLISDEAIAQVHADFMDDPTATDVITFHHGEILISTETAAREGPSHGNSPAEEILLYVVHGILHLNGHIDSAPIEREAMHHCQDKIVNELLLGDSPN